MADETLPEEIDKWALLVGRFISSFNEIELCSMKLWQMYFQGHKAPRSFSKRVNCLATMILENEGHEMAAEVARTLKAARKLARKRNIIAHNPIHVQVWRRRASEDYHIYMAISSENSEDILEKDMPGLIEKARTMGDYLFGFITAKEREAAGI